ncbi:group II intron reverse transcriptase domain-containing protein [bacterium]|nr:group II intron reverse transcriptase domain-containing protein [bacterium]
MNLVRKIKALYSKEDKRYGNKDKMITAEKRCRNSKDLMDEIASLRNLEVAFKQEYKNTPAQNRDNKDIAVFKNEYDRKIRILAQELQKGLYKTSSVKYFRLYPKKRKIALITFKDRIVQRAVFNVIRPGLEKILSDSCYAFRLNGSVQEAQKRALQLINTYPVGIKADIKDFFDSIPHKRLIFVLKQYIPCKRTIKLLQILIKQGDKRKGILQGSCLSPLLSNIYLTHFDKQISKKQHYFRYCDDLLLLTNSKHKAKNILNYMKSVLKKDYGLTINNEKTYVFDIYQGFSFLGVFFRKERT